MLIEGYSAQSDWGLLAFLGIRLILALHMLASAVVGYDRGPMSRYEISARLLIAVLVPWKAAPVMWVGIALAIVIVV